MYARMNDIERVFGAMDLLRNKMSRLFNEFDRSYDLGTSLGVDWESPRTNLFEADDHFEIQAELPGLSKENLGIKLQGNYLEISGNRPLNAPDGYKAHRNERGALQFSRSFTLPENVDSEKVEAVLKDGILHLTLPKSEAAKPKQITIH